jgi:hypothetical protein
MITLATARNDMTYTALPKMPKTMPMAIVCQRRSDMHGYFLASPLHFREFH